MTRQKETRKLPREGNIGIVREPMSQPPPVLLQQDLCGGLIGSPFSDDALKVGAPHPIIYVEFDPAFQHEFLSLDQPDQPTADSPDSMSLIKLLRDHGLVKSEQSFKATLREHPTRARFYTLYFDVNSDVQLTTRELNHRPMVISAVTARKLIPPQLVPNPLEEPLLGTQLSTVRNPETDLDTQWYIFRCAIDRAWKQKLSGKGVTIADVDWGFRTTHFDLANAIKLTHNSMDGSSNVSSSILTCHGTAVLGLAAANNNNYGMVGVGYEADVWAIMAGNDPSTTIDPMPWCDGIDFVRRENSNGQPKIIILEVQTLPGENIEVIPQVREVIKEALRNCIIVCVAAGNGSLDAGKDAGGISFPETGSIVVGATRYDALQNPLASFSNFGSRVSVYAPGDPARDLTCSSRADNGYRNRFGGTSGATAKVAGTIALMLEANSDLKPNDIKEILEETGSPITTDNPTAAGGIFLNAENAVTRARDRHARLKVSC